MKKKKDRWHRGKKLRIGDTFKVRNEDQMRKVITDFARRGIDAKPVYGEMMVEIVDID